MQVTFRTAPKMYNFYSPKNIILTLTWVSRQVLMLIPSWGICKKRSLLATDTLYACWPSLKLESSCVIERQHIKFHFHWIYKRTPLTQTQITPTPTNLKTFPFSIDRFLSQLPWDNLTPPPPPPPNFEKLIISLGLGVSGVYRTYKKSWWCSVAHVTNPGFIL